MSASRAHAPSIFAPLGVACAALAGVGASLVWVSFAAGAGIVLPFVTTLGYALAAALCWSVERGSLGRYAAVGRDAAR